MIPAFRSGIQSLRSLHSDDDFEKYLDIYDVSREAILDASSTTTLSHDDDPESLMALRLLSYQYSTLRRTLLCSLLSIEADGGHTDFARWRMATEVMDSISELSVANAQCASEALKAIEGMFSRHVATATAEPY